MCLVVEKLAGEWGVGGEGSVESLKLGLAKLEWVRNRFRCRAWGCRYCL